MKRNILIGLMVAALFITLIGCNKDDINNRLIDNTKLIESLDYKFSYYEITYEKYEKGITDLAGKIDMEENLNRNFPLPNELIKTLSEDEFNIMAENRGKYSVDVEISNVYDYLDIKYVYTKAVIVPEENNEVGVELTETRRYVYVLEDDQWVLANIERRMYEKDVETEDMEHVRFDNELVDYVERFNPFNM